MKKFLPYILIFAVIVQLFAPFSFGVGKIKLINKNVASAASIDEGNLNDISKPLRETAKLDCLNSNLPLKNFCLTAAGLNDGKNQSASLFIYLLGQRPVKSVGNIPILTLTITDDLGNIVSADNDLSQWSIDQDQGLINKNDPDKTKYDGYLFGLDKINGLTKGRKYNIKIEVLKGIANPPVSFTVNGIYISEDGTQTTTSTVTGSGTGADSGFLPACNPINGYLWTGEGTFMGCVVQFFYYVLFVPTSYLFALTGSFLDTVFHFSIQDESYRTPFVTEGWKLIRDFCNMFFIFVLLYIALGTILKIGAVKTQEMIINVVIIGLLINFSLFATQVIIDASNILARVFYDSDIIRITEKGANGIANATPGLKIGPNGEIPISAAIVNKVNPQNLIINSKDAVKINDKLTGSGDINSTEKAGGLSAGSWIVIIFLASIVNVVGIIAFLSASLIFVSRVIGLWFAMILAPLAFFSYIVPQLRNTEMIGWEKWWPNTLKLAFLAPIFTFFMYIIIMFLDKGLSLVSSSKSTDGLTFVISIIIPFVFIMVLLMKAKDIAKNMSGELGQSITKGIAAVGGVALGGAALGTAALGRKTFGSVAKYIQNDGARNKDLKTFGGYKDWSLAKKLNPFAYVGQAGKVATSGTAALVHATGLGKKMQESEQSFGHKTHATHILDAKMQSEFGHTYGKDAKYKDLSEHEQKIVKQEVDKDEIAKHLYGKLFKDLEAPQAADVQDMYIGRGAFAGHAKRAISDEHGKTLRVDDEKATLAPGEKIKSDYFVSASKANAAMGEFIQSLRKGSYDIRNISQSKFTSKGLGKMGVGLAATVASGVRLGLKKGVGIEHGTGQKDIFKDIGNTIAEALKGIQVNIDTGSKSGDGGHKEVKSVGH